MQDTTVNTELNRVLSGPLAPSLTNANNAQAALLMSGGLAGDSGTGSGQNALAEALTQNTARVAETQAAIQGQVDSLVSNTQAVTARTSTSSGGGSTAANIAEGYVSAAYGGGILGPIISGLMSLFGGGDDETPAPLSRFVMPPKIAYEAGGQGATIGNVDYDQNGQPRLVSQAPASTSSAAPQITVNVSAMDSQSFLDRSTDIANAVRKAMLESSSLNDVIGEL
jgi:hypothetical protein